MGTLGKQTWQFKNDIYLSSSACVAGPMEAMGPLASYYDQTYDDMHCGEKNWELAERRLMEDAVKLCLQKKGLKEGGVDLFLAGDLLNQIVTASFIAKKTQIPYLGMFGACSTSMETLAVGSALVDAGFADKALATVSSHYATVERQFRNPTEYGGPKPPTAESTVTGAGAGLVSREPSPIRITEATIGKAFDWGIKDANDMGSAMAPAAADTIASHLTHTERTVNDYDMILTGDLSSVGTPILKELLYERGFDISGVHQDCGLMVYRPDQKNVFAGGSGAACSAIVTYGYIVDELTRGNLNRVLVVATGALHNPTMVQQNEPIPTVAHAVVMEATGGSPS